MNINLLAINLGNTRCQIGAYVAGELETNEQIDPRDAAQLEAALGRLFEPLADADDAVVYIGAVNPDAAKRVAEAVRKVLGLEAIRVERDVNVAIGRQLDRETIVGEDRLLNAAAAYEQVGQACAVVDAGTAVTVDFVDGNGTFHGGAILPGAQMMLDAMHEHTAQLPELRFAEPDEAIGHSTGQAMLDGVFHGIRGAVRELVEKYAEVYGAYPRVIATGGNAHQLFDEYELVEKIVDDLTLRGMVVTHAKVLEQG